MSTESFQVDINQIPDANNLKIGIVVSNWNSNITNNLLKGSLDLLYSPNFLPQTILHDGKKKYSEHVYWDAKS